MHRNMNKDEEVIYPDFSFQPRTLSRLILWRKAAAILSGLVEIVSYMIVSTMK